MFFILPGFVLVIETKRTETRFLLLFSMIKFFQEYCKFTKLQRKNSADLATLLQAMILFHNKYYEYEFSSISDSEILSFANYIKDNCPEEMKTRLYDIVSYLELVFHSQEKQLKKINIPMVLLCADILPGIADLRYILI